VRNEAEACSIHIVFLFKDDISACMKLHIIEVNYCYLERG